MIHDDDFGHDQDGVLATIKCFEAGVLTSITIMPRMLAIDLAIRFARENPQHAYGVHLMFFRDTGSVPNS